MFRIFGPPGTGKTTTLLNMLDKALESGVTPTSIAFLAFTRKAANEAKEEILLRRPWTNEEDQLTYFRLRDFENFLKKNKFFEYKSHKIAQRLRDINGSSTVLKIQNRSVRCWAIPAYENADMELNPPSMGNKQETPF